MTDIEKMNLESKDLVAERIEQLKSLFPEISTEGSIDFDKLPLPGQAKQQQFVNHKL